MKLYIFWTFLLFYLTVSPPTSSFAQDLPQDEDIDEGPSTTRKLRAVQLINHESDGSLSLNKKALQSVLKNEKLNKRKAVIVSVVGAYRRGKSFLLNFMIRFLRAQGSPDWLGSPHQELEGFDWSTGRTRNTNGILIWPEIFPVGDDTAVILLDTQGSFDSEATFKENSLIFALSSLLSSMNVYNLHERIQMDDLDNLQFFMELGRLAQDDASQKPFQNLLFLIRDWKYSEEIPYGFEGGKSELKHWLRKHTDQRGSGESVANYFSQIACYLMPYPGDTVARSSQFRGKLTEIDSEFTDHLEILLRSILTGPGLATKQFSGQNVLVKHIPDYMSTFLSSLQSDKVPQPRSLLESTAALSNVLLARDAKDSYKSTMDKKFSDKKSIEDLEALHNTAMEATLNYFDSAKKFGGVRLAAPYREQLIKELESRYEIYKNRNEKRIQHEREMEMKMQILNKIKGMFEWTISNIAYLNMENIYKAIQNFDIHKIMEQLDLSKLISMIDLKTSGVFYIGAVLLVIVRVAATVYNKFFKNETGTKPIIEETVE